MRKADVLTLITASPEARGVGTEPTETTRDVYCTVRSVGQQEAYLAMGQGLNPELKVILAHDIEYEGEGLGELGGVRYEILRTYVTEADGIELTLQRVKRNAGHLPDPEPVTPDSETPVTTDSETPVTTDSETPDTPDPEPANTETVNTETAGSAEGVG